MWNIITISHLPKLSVLNWNEHCRKSTLTCNPSYCIWFCNRCHNFLWGWITASSFFVLWNSLSFRWERWENSSVFACAASYYYQSKVSSYFFIARAVTTTTTTASVISLLRDKLAFYPFYIAYTSLLSR